MPCGDAFSLKYCRLSAEETLACPDKQKRVPMEGLASDLNTSTPRRVRDKTNQPYVAIQQGSRCMKSSDEDLSLCWYWSQEAQFEHQWGAQLQSECFSDISAAVIGGISYSLTIKNARATKLILLSELQRSSRFRNPCLVSLISNHRLECSNGDGVVLV